MTWFESVLFFGALPTLFLGIGVIGLFGWLILPPMIFRGGGVARLLYGLVLSMVLIQLGTAVTSRAPGWQYAALLVWTITLTIVGGWFVEPALKALYALTPHPAQIAVDAAILRGERVDISELKTAIAAPTFNRFEREVRERQLREATERLRRHEKQLAQEAEAQLAEAKRRAEEVAQRARELSVSAAGEDLLKALLSHETVAARAKAIRKKAAADGA